MGIDVQQTLSAVRSAHRTNKYNTNALIVRRGLSVRLGTTSSRLSAKLIPIRSSRRLDEDYSIDVSLNETDKNWKLETSNDATNEVNLYIPVDAKIGLYLLRDEEDNSSNGVPLVVLFNPYNSEDEVYMSDENELNEYINNEQGRIWRGSHNSFSGMPWLYSQFNIQVLISTLDLLDRIPIKYRSNSIMITRYFSALLNSSDNDNGVIIGNWSGNYEDGTSPTAWTGSLDILTKYWESGSRPVPYGQCWVFAGVFNSTLRTLGIPSQVISNFSSAHESKPYNRILEHFYNTQGEPIPERNMGSTWNFHVWNMVWMKRPDLERAANDHGLNYDGWQIVDATPQEQSMGLFQLGPCPIEAIKNGYEVDFDADFVIGEVNADMVYYVNRGTEDDPNYEEFSRNRTTIGKNMSVKQVGRDAREDVTSMYKFREGSSEERESFFNREKGRSVATRSFNPFARSLQNGNQNGNTEENDDSKPVSFNVTCPSEIPIGKDFSYSLDLKLEDEDIKVNNAHVNIHIEGTDYTGQSMGKIKTVSKDIDFTSSSENSISVDVTADEYEQLLRKGVQTIHFDCAVIVKGENNEIVQTWSEESLVRINVDDILTAKFADDIEVKTDENGNNVGYVAINNEFKVIAMIHNTSHTALSGVILRVEGEGIKKLEEIKLDDLQIGENREVEISCKSTKKGDRLLVMTLDTVEIMDVARSMHVLVQVEEGYDISAVESEEVGWEGDNVESVEGLVDISSR